MTIKTIKIRLSSPDRAVLQIIEYDPERYRQQYTADSAAFIPPPESTDSVEWDKYLEKTAPRVIAEPLATWDIGEFPVQRGAELMFALQGRYEGESPRLTESDVAAIRNEITS